MITAKSITLIIHNLLRWAIVISALYTLFRLFKGWLKNQTWQDTDGKAITIFTILLDIQMLVGMLLYFIFSDLIKVAFADFAAAMGNQVLRFFSLEHTLVMVIAIVIAHLAGATGKKEIPDKAKFKRAAFLATVAFLLLLAGIPWTSRPLIPVF